MKINPLTAIDFYKTDHRRQYPEGTTEVYANFTPRSNRLAKFSSDIDNAVIFFGLQYFETDLPGAGTANSNDSNSTLANWGGYSGNGIIEIQFGSPLFIIH